MSDDINSNEADHMKLPAREPEFPPAVKRRVLSLPPPTLSRFDGFAAPSPRQYIASSNDHMNTEESNYRHHRNNINTVDTQPEVEVIRDTLSRASLEQLKGEDLDLEFSASFVAQQEAILSRIQRKERKEVPCTSTTNESIKSTATHGDHRREMPIRENHNLQIGSNIKIHDQNRVYDAIHNGNATVIKCIGCTNHMLSTKDIELVFCPGCGILSPTKLAQISRGKCPASIQTSLRRIYS